MRRNEPARCGELDWYAAKWLAVAFATLLLSSTDSLLTLVLLDHGAVEVNPLMRILIQADVRSFALIKLGLTAFSLVTLIALSRGRLFSRFSAGAILYAALVGHVCLIGYELSLLDVWAY